MYSKLNLPCMKRQKGHHYSLITLYLEGFSVQIFHDVRPLTMKAIDSYCMFETK